MQHFCCSCLGGVPLCEVRQLHSSMLSPTSSSPSAAGGGRLALRLRFFFGASSTVTILASVPAGARVASALPSGVAVAAARFLEGLSEVGGGRDAGG